MKSSVRPVRELVVVPVRGMTDPRHPVPLDPNGVLTIGRSGDIKLHDTLVNVRHAEIYLDPEGRYVIRDLASTNGTLVDGEVVHDGFRPIRAGTELRFGDTTLRIERPRRAPDWWPWLFIIPLFFTALCGAGVLGMRMLQGDKLLLTASQDIWRGPLPITRTLEVPPTYLRHQGLPWHMKIREVTDYDEDGRSELWIDVDGKDLLVVTFDDAGGLVDLVDGGLLPGVCAPAERTSDHFPRLACAGEEWGFDPELHRYRAIGQEGVVVWYRDSHRTPRKPLIPAPPPKPVRGKKVEPAPAPPPPPPVDLQTVGPLKVVRVPLKDPIVLGMFLTERSVYERVQYVVCEGAFDAVKAQALTVGGLTVPLEPGCIGQLRLEGQITGDPVAIALSPAGVRALQQDVARFYGGGADELFLPAERAALLQQLKALPGALKGSTKLVADTKDQVLPVPSPLPPGDSVVPTDHLLMESDPMHSPPPPSAAVVIPGSGRYEFAVADRCERFLVTAQTFEQPTGSCTDTFVTVAEVGCLGKPVQLPVVGRYSGGRSMATTSGGLDVMVQVDKYPSVSEDRILKVRLGWREHPSP